MGRQNPTVIIALGGNAISPKTEAGTIEQQFAHTRESLSGLKYFVRQRYNICITHGNGPQIGAELLKNENSEHLAPPLPLGVLVANTQGAIGYMIQQSLQNLLYKEDSNREVVTFISQVKVDKNDPAISKPTKYIGKRYKIDEKEDAERTLQFYHKDKCVIRLNFITVKTNFYSTPGGMQAEKKNRKEEALKSAHYLIKTYPNYVTLNLSKKSGHPEVKFKDKMLKKSTQNW